MSIITCGLSDEGVIATAIPFSTNPVLIDFVEDRITEEFGDTTIAVEFSTSIPVVEFDIDIIRIEECSWLPA